MCGKEVLIDNKSHDKSHQSVTTSRTVMSSLTPRTPHRFRRPRRMSMSSCAWKKCPYALLCDGSRFSARLGRHMSPPPPALKSPLRPPPKSEQDLRHGGNELLPPAGAAAAAAVRAAGRVRRQQRLGGAGRLDRLLQRAHKRQRVTECEHVATRRDIGGPSGRSLTCTACLSLLVHLAAQRFASARTMCKRRCHHISGRPAEQRFKPPWR